MDKDQVAPPNYGEVKFPRLVGGVISRPFDRGLRILAAVRTFESRRDRRWLDERLAEYSPPSRHRDLDYVACKKTLSSIVTCGFLSRLWYSHIASLVPSRFVLELILARSPA